MYDIKEMLYEFVLALNDEINALKDGKGATSVDIFEGRYLAQLEQSYIYEFKLRHHIYATDDTPAKIMADDKCYQCILLGIDGLKIEIASQDFMGEKVNEAILETNLWYLYEMLVKKIIAHENSLTQSKLISHLLQDKPTRITHLEPIYKCGRQRPNANQARAIENSFSQSLTIIWGPPGTGKTATIAMAAEAHLRAGRRVLLSSHSNTAVDQALLKIAAQMHHTPYYDQGKIVRLGLPRLNALPNEFPFVIPSKIIEQSHPQLAAQYKRAKADLKRLRSLYAQAATQKELKTLEELIKITQTEKKKAETAIHELETEIVADAALVATTLTKTFSSPQFPEEPFDVVIVDEVSMASLPQLFWSISRGTQSVTLVGDFLQLSAICAADSDIAQRWLKRNIFDLLQITDPLMAKDDPRVSPLTVQYRMVPAIARIPNKYFYADLLQNATKFNQMHIPRTKAADHPLVLIDTSQLNPWASRPSNGGRFNVQSAFITAAVAEKVLQNLQGQERIGIVTPYRAQARLITAILNDKGLDHIARVNTVHSFQGGEETAIIFDCVEGVGVGSWSMLDDQRPETNAKELLNVAITRAKEKFIVVGNRQYLTTKLNRNAIILKILQDIETHGYTFNTLEATTYYFANDLKGYLAKSNLTQSTRATLSQTSFWPAFLNDIKTAKESIIIMSPIFSAARIIDLADFFATPLSKRAKFIIYTKPIEVRHQKEMNAITQLGVKIVQRNKMHQKIAIIDDKITWVGNLNILSNKNKSHYMQRHVGTHAATECKRCLELPKPIPGELLNISCPRCSNPLVMRRSKYGYFAGCSTYPKCHYKQKMRPQDYKRYDLG